MRFVVFFGIFCAFSCRNCRKTPNSSDAGVVLAPKAWLEGTPVGETATPQQGGTLVIRVMTEPGTLNFLEGASRESWTSRMTRNLVVESLLDIDPMTFDVVPSLAQRWVDSADHRITTITLRGGVHFHDGSVLTSADVIAVLDAVKNPTKNTSSVRADFDELMSWRALDEHTVELRWRNPSPFSLRALAKLPILPASALAADWVELGAKPVGTGPYAVESWQRGQTLTLKRVDPSRGYLDSIVYRFVKDATVAAGLFDRGELDLMTNVQPTLWKELEQSPRAIAEYRRLKGVDNSYSYIAWNETVPALADSRVRRALAHLYPREAVEKTVDLKLEQPTTCPFWSTGPSCDPSVEPISFSPEAARNELLDAGFVDGPDGVLTRDGDPLQLHFLMPATSVRLAKLTPMLQDQFHRIGAELIIETVDVSHMSARVGARDFEVVSRVWTELDAVQDQYSTYHSSQIDGGANFVHYSSERADALMQSIRAEWDTSKRQALERALHRQLYFDQPYLFMTSRASLDLAKQRVHGLTPSPLWYDLRRVWVEH